MFGFATVARRFKGNILIHSCSEIAIFDHFPPNTRTWALWAANQAKAGGFLAPNYLLDLGRHAIASCSMNEIKKTLDTKS